MGMRQSATVVTHIFREMELHIGYCEGFGISREEMENTEELEGKSRRPVCTHPAKVTNTT